MPSRPFVALVVAGALAGAYTGTLVTSDLLEVAAAGLGVERATFDDEPETARQVAATLEDATSSGRISEVFHQAALGELTAVGGDPATILPSDAVLDVQADIWQWAGNLAELRATILSADTTDAFVLIVVRDVDELGWISHTEQLPPS